MLARQKWGEVLKDGNSQTTQTDPDCMQTNKLCLKGWTNNRWQCCSYIPFILFWAEDKCCCTNSPTAYSQSRNPLTKSLKLEGGSPSFYWSANNVSGPHTVCPKCSSLGAETSNFRHHLTGSKHQPGQALLPVTHHPNTVSTKQWLLSLMKTLQCSQTLDMICRCLVVLNMKKHLRENMGGKVQTLIRLNLLCNPQKP